VVAAIALVLLTTGVSGLVRSWRRRSHGE
jgi:hypothetical protein